MCLEEDRSHSPVQAVAKPGTPESSPSHVSALWPCQEAEGPMNYEHCLPRPPYFCLA